MPKSLHPLQRYEILPVTHIHESELFWQVLTSLHNSGIGNVANSIIGGLAEGPFENVQVTQAMTVWYSYTQNYFCILQVWTEVLQDSFLQVSASAPSTRLRLSCLPLYSSWTAERCGSFRIFSAADY